MEALKEEAKKPGTGEWTPDEVAELVKLQAQFGNKWVKIAKKMPGRTSSGIRNWIRRKRKREAKRMASSGNAGKDESNKRRRDI